MRILFTADPELPVPPKLYGGIERIIDILIRELRVRGHTIGLVAHPDSTSSVDQFVAWPGSRSQNKLDVLKNITALYKAVRKFKPDLIHSFSRLMYLLPFLGSRIPKVMSYQRQPTSWSVEWGARLANGSLTFTGASNYLCEIGKKAGGAWRCIPNCVDLSKYIFRSNVAENAPLIFLSRVEKIKGVHLAIAIARRSGRRLLIAGNHSATREDERYWEREIAPYLGKDGIEYVGSVDDQQKNTLLGRSIALVVPIEWDEPFGIVFIEALACGTPVISCSRGALPEIIKHGREGYLINTVEDGVEAVNNLHEINRLDCRRRIEEEFSAEVIVSQYESLYRRVTNQR